MSPLWVPEMTHNVRFSRKDARRRDDFAEEQRKEACAVQCRNSSQWNPFDEQDPLKHARQKRIN